jgi:hypothetical protein
MYAHQLISWPHDADRRLVPLQDPQDSPGQLRMGFLRVRPCVLVCCTRMKANMSILLTLVFVVSWLWYLCHAQSRKDLRRCHCLVGAEYTYTHADTCTSTSLASTLSALPQTTAPLFTLTVSRWSTTTACTARLKGPCAHHTCFVSCTQSQYHARGSGVCVSHSECLCHVSEIILSAKYITIASIHLHVIQREYTLLLLKTHF